MELTGYAGPEIFASRQEAPLLAQQLSQQTERDGQPFGGNTPNE